MAPPQNVKIQQKDTGNQPSLLNDADLVQDDDMAMAGKPSIIVSPVDQLDQLQGFADTSVFATGSGALADTFVEQ